MKFLFAVLVLGSVSSAMADKLVNAHDVEPILTQMRESGKITAEQEAITRRYMQEMKPSDWQAIQDKAGNAIHRNPAAADRVAEEGIESLDGADFGITHP